MLYSPAKQQQLQESTTKLLSNLPDHVAISELRNVLRYHEWRYYIQHEPSILDQDYDQLFNHLKALESAHPELITADSPTQRVASDIGNIGNSVAHIRPMLSLDNSYNGDDLRDFDKSIRKQAGLDEAAQIEYSIEPKYDGGSVAFVYENNFLVRGATRGNGTQGEEMTANAKTLPTIPLKAAFEKFGIKKAELRGEAVIRKTTFDKINEQRAAEGKSLFANTRNTAAGGLRTKNPLETRDRGIEVFIFEMGYVELEDGAPEELQKHFDRISILGKLGFKVPHEERKLCSDIEEVIKFAEAGEANRDDYPYEIDGMVIKVNDIAIQERCGYTQHHPRWAIAYKFKAKQAITTLEGIEYQIGKIGSVTPVAKVKPVHLAGVTISSISLHNEEFISSKDLRIGDQILVERAGDVIPYIVKSFPDRRTGVEKPVIYPSQCPSCDSDLIKLENEAAWRCVNVNCPEQNLQKMIYHVSKDAMDIDGFGKSYVERFSEQGWLTDIADIYNLDYDAIAQLDGFGEKSAEKIEASIERAKKNPLQRILQSLTIHHLGKRASKLVAEQVANIFELQDWTEERIVDIPAIGPVVAKNLMEYFANEANVAMLRRMESYGVDMSQKDADKPIKVAEDAPFVEKTILFTGSLQEVTRKQAQELATKAGAKNISAVSKNLNILVVGEKAGSKLKKAQALGTVQILTEAEFLELVNA